MSTIAVTPYVLFIYLAFSVCMSVQACDLPAYVRIEIREGTARQLANANDQIKPTMLCAPNLKPFEYRILEYRPTLRLTEAYTPQHGGRMAIRRIAAPATPTLHLSAMILDTKIDANTQYQIFVASDVKEQGPVFTSQRSMVFVGQEWVPIAIDEFTKEESQLRYVVQMRLVAP